MFNLYYAVAQWEAPYIGLSWNENKWESRDWRVHFCFIFMSKCDDVIKSIIFIATWLMNFMIL